MEKHVNFILETKLPESASHKDRQEFERGLALIVDCMMHLAQEPLQVLPNPAVANSGYVDYEQTGK